MERATRDNLVRGHPVDLSAMPAFGALRSRCFSSPSDGEYVYKVCLFDKATQQKVVADRSSHSLGQKWSWVSATEGAWVGKLSGGERCFNGPPRSFTVEFTCGPKEVLGAVSEKEVCTYGATLTTPARGGVLRWSVEQVNHTGRGIAGGRNSPGRRCRRRRRRHRRPHRPTSARGGRGHAAAGAPPPPLPPPPQRCVTPGTRLAALQKAVGAGCAEVPPPPPPPRPRRDAWLIDGSCRRGGHSPPPPPPTPPPAHRAERAAAISSKSRTAAARAAARASTAARSRLPARAASPASSRRFRRRRPRRAPRSRRRRQRPRKQSPAILVGSARRKGHGRVGAPPRSAARVIMRCSACHPNVEQPLLFAQAVQRGGGARRLACAARVREDAIFERREHDSSLEAFGWWTVVSVTPPPPASPPPPPLVPSSSSDAPRGNEATNARTDAARSAPDPLASCRAALS